MKYALLLLAASLALSGCHKNDAGNTADSAGSSDGQAASASPGGTPVPDGPLRILRATWKVQGLPDADVTDTLARRVVNGRLETKVGAAALGVQGKSGVTGNLVVVYAISGQEHTRTIRGGGN